MGEVQGKLEFTSNDLGQFTYDLILRATPASPEKAIYLRTCLGQNQVQTARFLNYAKQKTDYACKVGTETLYHMCCMWGLVSEAQLVNPQLNVAIFAIKGPSCEPRVA